MTDIQQKERNNAILVAEWTLPSTLESLSQVRAFVRWICEDFLCPAPGDETVELLELAVNEAVSNIVIHAYEETDEEEILLEIEAYTDRLCIYIYHNGDAFEPEQIPVPAFDGSQEHGFGLYLISQCVDRVDYFQDPEKGSAIRLIKKRNPTLSLPTHLSAKI